MFTVHFQIVGQPEQERKLPTLAAARKFFEDSEHIDFVFQSITDGDKEYSIKAPTLH